MNKKLQKGFTLIELLIVMAILAILAVGVMIGLNPVEQLNRARDTNTITILNSLGDAFERYYASNQAYPWTAAVAGNADITYATYVQPLVTSGDLKSSTTATTVTGIRLNVVAGALSTWQLCFLPQSSGNKGTGQTAAATKNGLSYKVLNASNNFVDPAAGTPCAAATCFLCMSGGQ